MLHYLLFNNDIISGHIVVISWLLLPLYCLIMTSSPRYRLTILSANYTNMSWWNSNLKFYISRVPGTYSVGLHFMSWAFHCDRPECRLNQSSVTNLTKLANEVMVYKPISQVAPRTGYIQNGKINFKCSGVKIHIAITLSWQQQYLAFDLDLDQPHSEHDPNHGLQHSH